MKATGKWGGRRNELLRGVPSVYTEGNFDQELDRVGTACERAWNETFSLIFFASDPYPGVSVLYAKRT